MIIALRFFRLNKTHSSMAFRFAFQTQSWFGLKTEIAFGIEQRKGGEGCMKVYHSWKRNKPSTSEGYSITVTITYSSFSEAEINQVEKKMPPGTMLIVDTDKPNRLASPKLIRDMG